MTAKVKNVIHLYSSKLLIASDNCECPTIECYSIWLPILGLQGIFQLLSKVFIMSYTRNNSTPKWHWFHWRHLLEYNLKAIRPSTSPEPKCARLPSQISKDSPGGKIEFPWLPRKVSAVPASAAWLRWRAKHVAHSGRNGGEGAGGEGLGEIARGETNIFWHPVFWFLMSIGSSERVPQGQMGSNWITKNKLPKFNGGKYENNIFWKKKRTFVGIEFEV